MTEPDFNILQMIYEKKKAGKPLSSDDNYLLINIIDSVMKPTQFSHQFDTLVFGENIQQKEELLHEQSSVCNKYLGLCYYICDCDSNETYYFCEECNKNLKGHKKHSKGKTRLDCLCNCGRCQCKIKECKHETCIHKKNSCPRHMKVVTTESRCKYSQVEIATSQLIIELLDCLNSGRLAEGLRITEYLTEIFESPSISRSAYLFLAQCVVEEKNNDSQTEDFSRFYQITGSGKNAFGVLCEFAVRLYSNDLVLSSSLITLIAQLETKTTLLSQTPPARNCFFMATYNYNYPISMVNELINKFLFCLNGNTVHISPHEINIDSIFAINHLIDIKDKIIKQFKGKESQLRKYYSEFVFSLNSLSNILENRFSSDNYYELYKCIIDESTIQNTFSESLFSFTPKLDFSCTEMTSLYLLLQTKLFNITHIYFNALILNMKEVDPKTKICDSIKNRLDSSLRKTDSKNIVIGTNQLGIGSKNRVTYAPLLIRCMAFLLRCRLLIVTHQQETFRNKKIKQPEKQETLLELYTRNKDYKKEFINMMYEFDIIDLFLRNLRNELKSTKEMKEGKVMWIMNSMRLFSFDPVLGRRLDLFMKQLIFSQYDFISDESERKKHTEERSIIKKSEEIKYVPYKVEYDNYYYLNYIYLLEENNIEMDFIDCDEKYITAYFLLFIDIEFVKPYIRNAYDVSRIMLIGNVKNYITVTNDNVFFSEKGPQLNGDVIRISPFNFSKLKLFNPFIPDFLVDIYQKNWLNTYAFYVNNGISFDRIILDDPVIKIPLMKPVITKMINKINIHNLPSLCPDSEKIDYSSLSKKTLIKKVNQSSSQLIYSDNGNQLSSALTQFYNQFAITIRYAWISSQFVPSKKDKEEYDARVAHDYILWAQLIDIRQRLLSELHIELTKKEQTNKKLFENEKAELFISRLNKEENVFPESQRIRGICLLLLESCCEILKYYKEGKVFNLSYKN
ncbi:hypothetical protein EHI8A_070850 [Entamoeba histolytica HM-1:IMSS-B]|uniref:Uncharacterized protein n=5 Tax=Entamoeba histolytica TaxID=5759 RepID=B1N3W4_ENTH1|nr:hypothetical protein EHI_181170 [Entamoeba histolytica HM-1:IMSS]EMH73387.1 hypothetical protein EHI8A_070850 [Entamoeba histolytica HM-1:IMSS-B]EMS13506.1 hypothetical protein KM1_126300 [Entamoeba histolytica HM-3:IMSS]ENY60631.1 hypothetical protein EHI7A_064730 [Entamoeba histolytica HM-1:IMSS-A]GAT96865.1 hypothetical protein CL6EHI_181170 [Entamoeba histolytica]EDS89344.1 hypothetical protein EHI_181170 [Entamoeba histolytica HM-1:IMSS]|eukprot:XP_001913880.1 hypothetical protein EHI_181170 [Entamoeba histolytica HM-1:IMSS]